MGNPLQGAVTPAQFATHLAETANYLENVFSTNAVANVYNPSIAVNGKTSLYSWGGIIDNVDSALLGKMPVSAGQTYTISIPNTENGIDPVLRCYDNGLVFIGNSSAVSTYPIATGISVTAIVNADGMKQITFTLSSISPVAFVESVIIFPNATHTVDDFNRIKNSIVVQIGSAYIASNESLKVASMPTEYSNVLNDVQSIKGSLKVIKSGSNIFLRTPWDATNDLIEQISLVLSTVVFGSNQSFEFNKYALVAKTVADADIPTAAMTLLKDNLDNIAPANYNGTYIGAGHGTNSVQKITVTAHGKTVQDVGSEWTDSGGTKFYIIRIVDANTLWMLSENSSVTDIWAFANIVGTTLTHSASATHTTAMTITTNVVSQLWPSIKNQVKKLLLNGKTEITLNGVYYCDYLDVVHTYDITDTPALLAFVRASVGGAVQPDFTSLAITDSARVAINYRFGDNGSCTISQSLRLNKNITMGYLGFIQSSPLPIPTSGTLQQYVPKTLPTTVNSVLYNFKTIQDITALANAINMSSAWWEDANSPPDRFIQFAKTSGGAKNNNFGFILGYCPEIGLGVPTTRKTKANADAFNLFTSKKQYPKAVAGASVDYPYPYTVNANSNFDIVAFRCPINYKLDPTATNMSWYYVGDTIYLMLDYHVDLNKVLVLPQKFVGKTVTVVEKSANFTLGSTIVTPDGIAISVTVGYGSAILKIN